MESKTPIKENLVFANYYAPRGRKRLYILGHELSERYLYPSDLLIGIIGAEGAGKSTLIKGLFPGLELTNDDDGVNIQPAPLFKFSGNDFFSGHTFHIDIRFESAFRQKYEIVEAIKNAINHNRRVIIEHFDLIYEHLGFNAQIIFGIGEEVIVVRPSVFGPSPEAIRNVVSKTIKFRLMAHSAEDITSLVLQRDYNYTPSELHSDIKHGFVIGFTEKPDISIPELETKINEIIDKDLKIQAKDESNIRIGEEFIYCTGVRTHVKSTGDIKNFRFLPEYRYDPISREYLLVGIVGQQEIAGFEEIAPTLG
ncbi:MAG: alanine-tRNA synthetase second additional domain-containing protein [Spirochaetales bacterium]|nr:alanine-tRNA synthetase second additional domain-containing protein [Spirochaetales bacterium]